MVSRLFRLAPLLLLTACFEEDEIIYGGGVTTVTLDDSARSGQVLSWTVPGIVGDVLAGAGGEVEMPFLEGSGGGALAHRQLHDPNKLYVMARADQPEEGGGGWFSFSGPVHEDCLAALRTIYFEYNVDFGLRDRPDEDEGFVYLRLFDVPMQAGEPDGDTAASSVFFDDDGPYGDEVRHAPIELAYVEDFEGALTVEQPPWRWADGSCWTGFQPDLSVEWSLDAETAVHRDY